MDKNTRETGAIDTMAPHAAIHLCVFHILQAIKRKLNTIVRGKERRREVVKMLQNIVYASTRNRFKEEVRQLRHQPDLGAFLGYFTTHWIESDFVWAQYQRKGVVTLSCRTNNYLESYHSKIKQFTRTSNTLSNCFIKVITLGQRRTGHEKRQSGKVTYKTRHNDPTSAATWFHAKSIRAKQILEERQQAKT